MPRPICLKLERQVACRAFSRACAKTGKRIAARMAIMAITTSSPISVKPVRRLIGTSTAPEKEHGMTTGTFPGGEWIPAAPIASPLVLLALHERQLPSGAAPLARAACQRCGPRGRLVGPAERPGRVGGQKLPAPRLEGERRLRVPAQEL